MKIKYLVIFILIITIQSCVSKKYTKIELEEDTKHLLKSLENIHPNIYAHSDSLNTINKINHIVANLERQNIKDYLTTIVPFVCSFQDGHTFIDYPLSLKLKSLLFSNFLYFNSYILPDSTIVVNSVMRKKSNITKGDTIISINNINSKEIIAKLLSSKKGKNVNFRLAYLDLAESFWYIYNYPKEFKIEYIQNGIIKTEQLKGIRGKKYWNNNYNSILTRNDSTQKNNLIKLTERLPLKSLSFRYNKDIAVLSFSKFHGNKAQLNDFNEAFKLLKNNEIKNLVIDLRNNRGGSTNNFDTIASYFTEKGLLFSDAKLKVSPEIKKRYNCDMSSDSEICNFLNRYNNGDIVSFLDSTDFYYNIENQYLYNGQVYVLIGPKTFSTACGFAAFLKDNTNAIFIGEETGGLSSSYGDFVICSLPNTGLKLAVSAKLLVRPNGVITNKGILPDYYIHRTIDDILNYYDAQKNFTFKLINKYE